jgi:hypothetical protein
MKIFPANILKNMIMETILTALKISLICTAAFASTWKGMIFHKPVQWIEAKIISFCQFFIRKMDVARQAGIAFCKPLFGCLVCMSSFWTLLYWLIFGGFNPVIMILLVCGINTIINAVIAPIIPDEE